MIKILNRFIEGITAIGMGALVLACIWQVVSRYLVGRPSTVTVITSYSIHYTKLYESL